jgi:fucose 4-O-acetylase-like acetyltransferase
MLVKSNINRNVFIDSLKGLLIIFVVIGHSPSVGVITKIIISLIYCFHMPAFFVLSSLNIKSRLIDELKGTKQILIVYLFWLIFSVLKNDLSFTSVLFFSNWHHLKNILWFLPALITFKIFYSLLLNNNVKWIAFILGSLTIVFSDNILAYVEYIPWGIHVVLYMTPCILILRELYPKIDFISKYPPEKATIVLSFLFIVFLILFIFVESSTVNSFRNHFLDFAQFIVPSVYGYFFLILMMFTIIALSKISIEKNLLSYIGKNTMPIYLFHFFFITQLSKFLNINNYFNWLLLVIFSVTLCLLISFFLKKVSMNFKYLGA